MVPSGKRGGGILDLFSGVHGSESSDLGVSPLLVVMIGVTHAWLRCSPGTLGLFPFSCGALSLS